MSTKTEGDHSPGREAAIEAMARNMAEYAAHQTGRNLDQLWPELAEVAYRALGGEWQSVDTAPKDGSLVLGWRPPSRNRLPHFICRWHEVSFVMVPGNTPSTPKFWRPLDTPTDPLPSRAIPAQGEDDWSQRTTSPRVRAAAEEAATAGAEAFRRVLREDSPAPAVAEGWPEDHPLVRDLIWEVDRAVKQAARENGRYDTVIRHILAKHLAAAPTPPASVPDPASVAMREALEALMPPYLEWKERGRGIITINIDLDDLRAARAALAKEGRS